MKVLHTSDWHLGRTLYGRKRYDEFAAFLQWLNDTIVDQQVDILLIAGDIFDTSTPSNQAQELYYRFLCRVAGTQCRHIAIIAGNHDSPSFLNAPRELLLALNVHVVGAAADRPDDEVLVLEDADGKPEAIVCAVPYLRDKDVRGVEPGETLEAKTAKFVEGVRNHYAQVCAVAETKRQDLKQAGSVDDIPIIATGHLFTTGGKTVEGDGVRELYVGTLAHVGEEEFPAVIDYLALGHLHVPQIVDGNEHMRYCGSPIPMGYGEARQTKQVVIVEFSNESSSGPSPARPMVRTLPVPCFQPLERISGSLDVIRNSIEELKTGADNAWLEIEYTGVEIVGNLRELLDEAIGGTRMEIRRVKNKRIIDQVIKAIDDTDTLDDLDAFDVFQRRLDSAEIPEADRAEMLQAYGEIVRSLEEEDGNNA